ncbi:MAG: cobalt transporter, inner rane subunit CbiQ [Clostridia bacterium]|jgi:cobalt/nickel transport system permease protein|nr:cobalt transporter, inner rane subunit CbiQ [Clostridia bacterium]
MANITQAYYKMFILDELAEKGTVIHRINPVVKLLVTFIYLLFVVSYDKYEISGLIPLFFYPVIIMSIGDIPLRPMLAGLAIAAPLTIGVGIFNPFLDRTIVSTLGGIAISAGMLSFISLLVKCFLTVLAALLLLATTGMNKIAAALQKLHVPQIFIIQMLLTYRYISVLMGETSRVYNAYSLRAPNQRGVSSKVWGSLIGLLLLRTYDRASRLYQAMKLRGFENHFYAANLDRFQKKDIIYLIVWITFFVIVRFINIPILLGVLVTGVIK